MQNAKSMWKMFIIVLLASFALSMPVTAAPGPDRGPEGMRGDKMQCCKQMMGARQKMISRMNKEDKELQEMVAKLNKGSEQDKVDMLTRIVKRMVNERTTLHHEMEAMHNRMMRHMAQNMRGRRNAFAGRPMMHGRDHMGGSQGPDQQSQHGSSSNQG